MAGVDSTAQLTILELAKRKDPSGDLAVIAEIMAEDNAMLQDAVWVEGNDTFSHTMTRRATLPSGSWRNLNAGVPTEASQTLKAVEGMGMLESYSEVDKVLADAAPDRAQFRMDEAASFIEGLGQTLATTFFYGNSVTNPEQFTGLAPRMPAATTFVIDMGGTGNDETSLYIVDWGVNKVFMIYPKNHPTVGVVHENLGEVTLQDGSGNNYQGYRDHFQVRPGLAIKDPRCIARLGSIDPSGTYGWETGLGDEKVIQLLNFMPQQGRTSVIYVNPQLKTQMDWQIKDKANVNLTLDTAQGKPTMYFRGVPVRVCEAILSTEAAI